MEWQPIDTAPKDGIEVLTYRKSGCISVAAHFGGSHIQGWCVSDGMDIIDVTHWMPIPKAPKL